MGRLSTHVLDTSVGRPAADLKISLWSVDTDSQHFITSVRTNQDGRAGAPLLEGENFQKGIYELNFEAGNYLRANGVELADPAFLDIITIRFGIADPDSHYHVPLLLSPYGYSTYRGS